MLTSWSALHAQLLHTTTRLTFRNQFNDLRRSHTPLEPFRDPDALLAWLHDLRADADAKNDVLRCLVGAAQVANEGETARVLLIVALWPGLDAIRGRLRRHYVREQDDLVSDLTAGISWGIAMLDLSRVYRIAATLLRNLERDLRRDLIRRRAIERQTDVISQDLIDPASLRCPQSNDLAGLRMRLEAELGGDASLVIAVTVEGLTQREVAELLGIGHDAARKRYQRAMARLRERFSSDDLSQSGGADGFSFVMAGSLSGSR